MAAKLLAELIHQEKGGWLGFRHNLQTLGAALGGWGRGCSNQVDPVVGSSAVCLYTRSHATVTIWERISALHLSSHNSV